MASFFARVASTVRRLWRRLPPPNIAHAPSLAAVFSLGIAYTEKSHALKVQRQYNLSLAEENKKLLEKAAAAEALKKTSEQQDGRSLIGGLFSFLK